jgi:Caudovirus prohead serine protease
MKIHGCALPFNTRIEPLETRDTWAPFLIVPGAFEEALERPDLSSQLTIDHSSRPAHRQLASVEAGTLRYFQTTDGLMFEADLSGAPPSRARRVYELVAQRWITHCCLRMETACEEYTRASHPGTVLRVFQVPRIGDLALAFFARAHVRPTFVRVGPAPRSTEPAPRCHREPESGLYVRPVVMS